MVLKFDNLSDKMLDLHFSLKISLKRYNFPRTVDVFSKVFTTGETEMLLSDHGMTKESVTYLKSLLYSISNHIPKKRVCSPLMTVKTRAIALISGMSPVTAQM